MVELYNCKRTQIHEQLLISKFNGDLVVERSYFVGPKVCQCEAWTKRGNCRHQQIKTLFMMNPSYIDSCWFLEFNTRRWREYPQLAIDGTVGEYREKFDDLSIGDGGYQTGAGSASPVSAGACLSSPAEAPRVEAPTPPLGAPTYIKDGIKRRKGL